MSYMSASNLRVDSRVTQQRVRFKVRSLMIAVAVLAVLLKCALTPIALIVAFGLLYVALTVSLWWMFRGFRRLSALCCGVVAGLINTLSAGVCIYRLNMGGAFLMLLGWFWTFPIVIGTGVAWAGAVTRRTAKPRRSPMLVWPLVIVLSFLPLSMVVASWPFRLAFLVSGPAMDRLADRVVAGQSVSRPERVGLFRVVGSAVQPSTGNVGLIIDADPSGWSGFVRVGARPSTLEARSEGPFHNLNFDMQLRENWWYECED
jgi:hypothetical protein